MLIQGCMILPMNGKSLIEDGTIIIEAGKLAYVGERASSSSIGAKTEIDGQGKVAMPGLVNCHTHVAMTLFRGLADDEPLDVWLGKTIWPLEKKLKPRDVCAGALLGCLEMIKSGTTCFGDMYFHEGMVATAVERSGLRAALAEGIFDIDNRFVGEVMFRRSVRFAQRFRGFAGGRITTMLGPHAAYSCSPRLLRRIAKKACELGLGIHIHLAESKEMFAKQQKRQGLSEVSLLDDLDFLNTSLVAAHCIDLSDDDLRVLAQRGVNVVYCPVGNMKLGSGVAKMQDLVRLGVTVALGTDGPASNNCLDMFETMKVGALIQKTVNDDPSVMGAHEVLRMATLNGARALGIGASVGSLEVGKKADVILVDVRRPHLSPLHSLCAGLVYSAHGSDVDTVIVDGKMLMENGQVKTLDEEAVLERAEKTAHALTSR